MKYKKLNKIFYIFLFLNIKIICQNEIHLSYINNKDLSIKNAVYVIRNREGDLTLVFKGITYLQKIERNEIKNFLLIKENDPENEEDYFYIKDISSKVILSAKSNTITNNNNDIEKDYSLWKIIPKINENNNIIYYIQNKKNKKYWEINDSSKLKIIELKEVSNFNKNNEFQFNELYKEVLNKNSTILDKEPIDVLIKYIDLSDPKLNRTGIKQIKKDQDNEELKYSIRSILKNIPWIRKIYILMPNERVKYFKSPGEINEKIIYVKDKDLLGFDTASSIIFQFNLHKMKQFGLSENFILMDDDYFIAEPLNKNDFFYEENGTIYPALVTSDYYEMNKDKIQSKLSSLLKNIKEFSPNSSNGFYLRQNRALLFMYEIFGNDEFRNGKKLIEPSFTHNAIPIKISDIEEIYNHIMNSYKYANISLYSKIKTNYDLQMQTLYMVYVKNKYDRKVSKISSAFYDLSHLFLLEINKKKLFVINTSIKNYSKHLYIKERMILKKLFPTKTKYELNYENKHIEIRNKNKNEIINNNFLHNITMLFNKIKIINNTISNKTKYIKGNISNIINRIENIIDNANIIINKTKTIKDTRDIEINYKNFLLKEIGRLKKYNEWHRKINFYLLCFFLLFVIYRVYKYYKNIDNKISQEETF